MKGRAILLKALLLLLGICVAIVAFWNCQGPQLAGNVSAPLFNNLGDHSLKISTDSERAQQFFNQGLVLAYAFNHREAARAFKAAIKEDPDCSMCHWGLALVMGPNINAPMDPTSMGEVFNASVKAKDLSSGSSAWERDLIAALRVRYPDSTTLDRGPLDEAYAQAMASVYSRYPRHQDIATLYAEALMDVHPWDLYEKNGVPKSWTPKIVGLLETILGQWPDHPGANHLYIHAVEASASPERGLEAAKRLEDLVPGAGHLVHMPSHIYIRTGRYHQGSVTNQKAIRADSIYVSSCNAQGIYPLLYFPHNIHFLSATAALEGRGDISINAAFQLRNRIDREMMKDPAWATLQHFYSIPFYVMVKFGEWDRILDLPMEELPYPKAVLHYARGMALVNIGELEQGKLELEKLHEVGEDPSLDDMMIWDLNYVSDLIEIASRVLESELATASGQYVRAVELLSEAVAIEDGLTYTEPPDWFFSVRHHLGAALLKAGHYAEAEVIYGEDLFNLPENGWALNGLYHSLLNQNKTEAAQQVKLRFQEAWKYANIQLDGSLINKLSYNSYSELDLYNDQLSLASIESIPWCGK